MNDVTALLGILSGMVIPLGVFVWLYFDAKNKRAANIEIAKTIDDPSKVEELISKLDDEKKKEPIEYRRGGTITIFVGIGLYFKIIFLPKLQAIIIKTNNATCSSAILYSLGYPNLSIIPQTKNPTKVGLDTLFCAVFYLQPSLNVSQSISGAEGYFFNKAFSKSTFAFEKLIPYIDSKLSNPCVQSCLNCSLL